MVNTTGAAEEGEGVADPAHVELHRESIQPHRYRTVLYQPLGHLGLVLRYLHPATHSGHDPGPVKLACLVITIIAILLLRLQTSYLKKCFICILHEPPIAAVVPLVAVHQLLLRQAHQFPILDGVLTLNIARHAEGPARAAHPLVLHLGNGPVLPPVETVWKWNIRDICWWPVNIWVVRHLVEAEVVPLELLFREICKMSCPVDSAPQFGRLQLVHLLHVFPECSVPVLVLVLRGVGLVVFVHEFMKSSQAVQMQFFLDICYLFWYVLSNILNNINSVCNYFLNSVGRAPTQQRASKYPRDALHYPCVFPRK